MFCQEPPDNERIASVTLDLPDREAPLRITIRPSFAT